MKTNYLSSWIANLGVVPLLLFAAFLLVPPFFFLIFLLIRVIVVLDDIILPFELKFLLFIKHLTLVHLTKIALIVKGLFVSFIISLPTFALTHGNHDYIILSRGEQREFKTGKFTKFSLGNSEVIGIHPMEENLGILIKARAIGFSDIVLWTPNGIKKIDVVVVGKTQYLKTLQIAESYRNLGLDVHYIGGKIHIRGEVETLKNWMTFSKLTHLPESQLDVNIKQELTQNTIATIYKELLNEGVSWVECFLSQNLIECEYAGSSIDEILEKKLKSKFPVNFSHNKKHLQGKNYRLKFKIIQIEYVDQRSLNLGLNKISTTLQILLQKDLLVAMGTNDSLIAGLKGNYELISEPEQIVTLGNTNIVEIGAEIPYLTQTMNGNDQTHWKFAGIRVESLIQEKNQNFFMKYQTEMTRPIGQSISGSKESSHIYLKEKGYLKIFELNFKAKHMEDHHMPLLGEIPILKYFFSSNDKGESFKQIIGFVLFEELQ